MPSATVTLHGDLNDFVSSRRTAAATTGPVAIRQDFNGSPAVKDVIESVGVPHPEIAAITINGEPADLARRLADGDHVEAWPAAEAASRGLIPALPAMAEDADEPRFVLDAHLGRLAAYLRMLGFDTWYRNDADDVELASVAAEEGRILLSRDLGLLKRSVIRRGAFLRSDLPVEQLVEVVRRFELIDRGRPFGRCLRCNHVLETVGREEIVHRLQPLTRIHYDDFRRCPGCEAIYWKGSHHAGSNTSSTGSARRRGSGRPRRMRRWSPRVRRVDPRVRRDRGRDR